VKQYGFQGIPFTVLVDREGKIVAKGLRGQQLEEAVTEFLKK
jgi:thioredoxin-like negative regulator of GroEL